MNVNTAEGVVELRGRVETEVVGELAAKASKDEGVREVRGLLHPPGTAAPATPELRASLS